MAFVLFAGLPYIVAATISAILFHRLYFALKMHKTAAKRTKPRTYGTHSPQKYILEPLNVLHLYTRLFEKACLYKTLLKATVNYEQTFILLLKKKSFLETLLSEG